MYKCSCWYDVTTKDCCNVQDKTEISNDAEDIDAKGTNTFETTNKKTKANEVIDFFESTFADKEIIPLELEVVWLRRAVVRYSLELDKLDFDSEVLSFNEKLNDSVIATLSAFMKEYYQERQVSKVNKRVSIVGKDLSIDGSNGTKTSEKNHLEYVAENARELVENQKLAALI